MGLQNDHPLAPDKIEIKKEMLFKYQLMSAGFHNILIGNTKKSVPNNSENEKYVLRYESFQIYLRLGLKEKKHDVLKFNQWKWIKAYDKFITQIKIEAEEKC